MAGRARNPALDKYLNNYKLHFCIIILMRTIIKSLKTDPRKEIEKEKTEIVFTIYLKLF